MSLPKAHALLLGGALLLALLSGMALALPQDQAPALPDDMSEYKHINTLVVPQSESPIHGIHHFYMSPEGREAFLAGGTDEYPDGTIIVGKVFQPVETGGGHLKEGELAAYTLMVKDSNAPATRQTGGWHFAMFGPDRKNQGVDPVEGCFGCHTPSPETDFVLSKPLK
jgi:hypothetical protein